MSSPVVPHGRYYVKPDLAEPKGCVQLRGLDESAVVAEGFVEVGKYGLHIQTKDRMYQFYTDSDSSCKAWKKNLVNVTMGGR